LFGAKERGTNADTLRLGFRDSIMRRSNLSAELTDPSLSRQSLL
jgi:hypothetical protein